MSEFALASMACSPEYDRAPAAPILHSWPRLLGIQVRTNTYCAQIGLAGRCLRVRAILLSAARRLLSAAPRANQSEPELWQRLKQRAALELGLRLSRDSRFTTSPTRGSFFPGWSLETKRSLIEGPFRFSGVPDRIDVRRICSTLHRFAALSHTNLAQQD